MSDPTFAFDQSQEQAARREAIRDWQERRGDRLGSRWGRRNRRRKRLWATWSKTG